MADAPAPFDPASLRAHYRLSESEHWELLARHLELADGYSFAVVFAPDDQGIAYLRSEFPSRLPPPGKWEHFTWVPSDDLGSLAALLLDSPVPTPEVQAIWLDSPPCPPEEYPVRDRQWAEALSRLNRYRNNISARYHCPLLLALPLRLLPVLRENAPDWWSIRSAVFRIEPPGLAATAAREWIAPREVSSEAVVGDFEETLRQAEKLRGKPGRELLLAELLTHAGRQAREALRWREAEVALQEAYDLLQRHGADPEQRIDLSLELGSLFSDEADHRRAEFYKRRALDESEHLFGSEHPRTTLCLNNLGQTLQATNRLAEAEPLMRRALEIDEAAFGSQHPRVAIDLNNLAQLLQATNRLAEAEPLMRRALQIDEAAFGPDHPRVAIDLNNLASLLQATNRRAEAEPLMRRALQIDEAAFGPQHPNVAIRLNNLAHLLHATNRRAEAEPLMRRALQIDEAAFGPQHPDVAIDLNNLAQLLKATNRLAEAEPLMRRALVIDEAAFGPEHPDVAIDLNNLAQLLQATNRLAEAEPLTRRALQIDEAAFGPEHPRVAIRLNNLAQLLQATNRLAGAEPLMRRALLIDEAAFGPLHPDVAIDLNNLASLLQATDRRAEAEPLLRRTVAIFLRTFAASGHVPPNLPAAKRNLIGLLSIAGHPPETIFGTLHSLAEEAGLSPEQTGVFLSLE